VIALLADENIPLATVRSLRAAGLDVRSAGEDMPGATDVTVLSVARSEGRLLLTFDKGFGELIYRAGEAPPPAVVYLRFVPASPAEAATVFLGLVDLAEIDLNGRFTVVTRSQVRQRPLP
jgi:predicted nuclease of predicted toxin-antitoxin system